MCTTLDSRFLLTGSSDNAVRLWSLETGALVRDMAGHAGAVWTAAVARNGRAAVTGDDSGVVLLWPLGSSSSGDGEAQPAAVTSSDERAGSDSSSSSNNNNNNDQQWQRPAQPAQLQQQPPIRLTGCVGMVHSVCFTADSRFVAAGDQRGTTRVWSMEDPAAPPRVFLSPYGWVLALCPAADALYAMATSFVSPVHVDLLALGDDDEEHSRKLLQDRLAQRRRRAPPRR
jgi:WD40 repeat protein